MNNKNRTWIREDTLTIQLAIPIDLRIYKKHIQKGEWYKVTGVTT